MIRRVRNQGFTLLETLVALAIAAMVLRGFYEGIATGSLLSARADLQADRINLAALVLDRVGTDIPLQAGLTDRGVEAGLEWELVISTIPPADLAGMVDGDSGLLFVAVTLDGPDDPVILRAIRYGVDPI